MEYIDIVNQIKFSHGSNIREDVFKEYLVQYKSLYEIKNPNDKAPRSGFIPVVRWGSERIDEFKDILYKNGIKVDYAPYNDEVNPYNLTEKGLKRLSELEQRIR